ncbi:MAG: polysaccharide biosynthesis C-terminal domain-containing protein [Blautia sp.]
MLYNATSAILRAIGDSRTPLFVLLFSSVLNIILDLLFVLAFHMGTTGVAVATVASQGISGILCLFYMFWHYEELRIRKEEFRVSLEKWRHF